MCAQYKVVFLFKESFLEEEEEEEEEGQVALRCIRHLFLTVGPPTEGGTHQRVTYLAQVLSSYLRALRIPAVHHTLTHSLTKEEKEEEEETVFFLSIPPLSFFLSFFSCCSTKWKRHEVCL